MKLPNDDRMVALVATLRGARSRISFTYLAYLAGINPKSLYRYMKLRQVRDAMRRHGWSLATSKDLGLPALEKHPHSVPFLVRNAQLQL